MKRTKAQACDTRATILDAAEAKFFSNGIACTTLGQIAEAAGVTRGAIYGHFKNKNAVFNAIFERFALPLDPFTIIPCDDASDPLGMLKAELEARLSRTLRDAKMRRLYGIVFARYQVSRETAPFFHRVRSASRLAEAQIEIGLRRAVSCKQLSPDFNAREGAFFIHATLTGILLNDLLAHRRYADLDPGKMVSWIFRCLTQSEPVVVSSGPHIIKG